MQASAAAAMLSHVCASHALLLPPLQAKGKIRHVGATNFDVPRLQEMLDAGVKLVNNQVGCLAAWQEHCRDWLRWAFPASRTPPALPVFSEFYAATWPRLYSSVPGRASWVCCPVKAPSVTPLQVQYSLLDRRPENKMAAFCGEHGIKLLPYGVLAGGLLTDKYLGMSSRE